MNSSGPDWQYSLRRLAVTLLVVAGAIYVIAEVIRSVWPILMAFAIAAGIVGVVIAVWLARSRRW
jgi:hypothetical protein